MGLLKVSYIGTGNVLFSVTYCNDDDDDNEDDSDYDTDCVRGQHMVVVRLQDVYIDLKAKHKVKFQCLIRLGAKFFCFTNY